jgi:hypothetical protein
VALGLKVSILAYKKQEKRRWESKGNWRPEEGRPEAESGTGFGRRLWWKLKKGERETGIETDQHG